MLHYWKDILSNYRGGGNSGNRVRSHKERQRLVSRRPQFEHLEHRKLLAIVVHPLVNAGFESPNLDGVNSYHPNVDGWTRTGFPGTTYEIPIAEPSPASEGEQYVYGDSSGWSISQNGPTIAADTRYILTADVHLLSTGSSLSTVQLRIAGTATILDAAANFSTPAAREVDIPEGEWTTIRVGFNSRDFAANIGSTIEVRLTGSHIAIDNVKLEIDTSVHDFYISSSEGSSSNDGFSSGAAFENFGDLDAYLPLLPGERILLKAGDTFTEELNIRGKGTAGNLVELSSYGPGPNPIIRRQDLANDVGVIWNNASYTRISNIDVEHSKLGIYLRYEWEDVGSRDVTIENSNFRDMTDPTLDASAHNFEYAWSDAIWVGGQAWNQAEFSTRLENLTIRHVTATNVAHLFGTGWYFPAVYRSRIRNLIIEDSVAYNALAGAFQLFNVDGGHIKRVHSFGGGGQDTWSGTTLGFMQSSQNFLIEDSEFSYIDRAQAADGSGMDFEGDNHNVTFRNNVVHNNAGSGLLILSTGGPNTNLVIEDNTFYNNARDPWNDEINSEVQGGGSGHTGIIRNNGFYRGDPSINFLSPSADWSGFTYTGNREEEYVDVSQRKSWWDFDTNGDFEGWGTFNHWANATVSGGKLTGQSTDVDAYVHSPPTWVSTNEPTYAWVRMSQTAGNFGQVFYVTETDPVWDGAKSMFFSINPDGNMHDYFIDLSSSTDINGVITQIRLDPTIVAGSDMEIDFIRLTDSTDLNQVPPSDPLPPPLEVTFNSIAAEDGYITESSQNSGVGGTVNSFSSTFRLGDDSSNRAYRKFLSFDTSSLPDNASIVEATIGITRVGNPAGNIPIGVATSFFGDLLVDIANPGFGSSSLASSDWQSGATKLGVSKFAWPAYLDGMAIYSRLENWDHDLINLTGRTQFRVRYQNDDDNDGVADYMSYATSNHSNASFRPTLNIKYYINDDPSADFNSDTVVSGLDFLIWQRNTPTYGTALQSDGDANTDTDVDSDDLAVWDAQYGTSALSAAITEQPEEAPLAQSVVVASYSSPQRVDDLVTERNIIGSFLESDTLEETKEASEEVTSVSVGTIREFSLRDFPVPDIAQFRNSLEQDRISEDSGEATAKELQIELVDQSFDESVTPIGQASSGSSSELLALESRRVADEKEMESLDEFFSQLRSLASDV